MTPQDERELDESGGSGKRLPKQTDQREVPIPRPFSVFDGSIGLLLAGLLLVTALLAVLGLGLIPLNSPPPAADPVSRSSAEPAPYPTEDEAVAALDRFFESLDVVTMAANVHDGPRVKPMMEDYYLRRSHPFPTMSRASKGQAMNVGGNQIMFFMVEPFSGPKYPVAVIWEGDKFAVDWESLAAYGTIDWGRFIEEMPGTTETLRVYVQGAGNLDEFPDIPEGHAVFRISHRDDPQPLTAIADAQITGILSPLVENRRVPLTLDLEWRRVGSGQVKLPVIIRVVAKGWSQ
jgi:hypothetical protein